jgi:L-lactate dehydrogenase complex protein LldF
VDLHAQLLLLRQRLTDAKLTPFIKRFVSILASKLLAHPGLFRWSGRMGRTLVRFLPVRFRHWLFRAYEQGRTVPELPAQSFHDWYRHRKGMR